MKMLNKLDGKLPLEGWKAALTGFIALLLPWASDLLVLLGGPQIPPEFLLKTQGVMAAFVGLFLLLKASRGSRSYDGSI
jgi:hypothetical protein